MSYSSSVSQDQLDYGFLLLTHIIYAYKKIDSEELKYLKELGDRNHISQQTKDEIDKIFIRDRQHITIDLIANSVSIEEQSQIMEQILAIFYEEDLFGLCENDAIEHIASTCNWSQKAISRIVKARCFTVQSSINNVGQSNTNNTAQFNTNNQASVKSQHSQNLIDYGFLLLVHLVCADQQIHSEELKYLQELGHHAKISQLTKDEMEKILAKDDHHLTVDYIASRVPLIKRLNTMRQILAVAYADDFLSSLEREMIDRIAGIWNLPTWSRNFINKATQFAPKTMGSQIKQLKREIPLLSKSEYEGAIQQCTKIASEDYKYAKSILNDSLSTLNNLDDGLQQVIEEIAEKTNSNEKATTAKKVAKQLQDSKESLTTEISNEIGKVTESLHAKERALNYFSIAFMGRTKAGKSTLHAIITQDGWDSIGVGKQRTTRFNRVYEFENIRIIDTPGIGAAAEGGRNDEEVAKSIIDQADVVCYVVTNDSIQETEFQFLKQLKERAKPLIILLNVKYNLRDSRRLEHFLKNPDKLFALEGKNGIGGHIDRIRRYANQYYANDYFPIVPVMLLAAQLSSEPEHQENKEKLFKASRIQDFLDSIRESLIKHGTIRRSQTFLGSTVDSIKDPDDWVTRQQQEYQKLIDFLKKKRQSIPKDVYQAQEDALESLQKEIKKIFQDAVNCIQYFAEDYWNERDENILNRGWKNKLKEIKFAQRIRNAHEKAANNFKDEVRESLEEIGRELQLIFELNSSNFDLKSQSSFDIQGILRIGGQILMGLGGMLLFFPPFAPIGGAAMAIGLVANLIGNLGNHIGGIFKSREEKRREAVAKISDFLRSQLKENKQITLEQTKNNFRKSCSDASDNINQYFNELIQGLEAISTQLKKAKKELDDTTNDLNRAYAKRIIDWSLERYNPLNNKTIEKTIAKVERNFREKKIEIITKSKLQPKKSLEEMKQVLQEDISITS